MNLDKMTSAMVKLDHMADDDKTKYECKLKDRRKKILKLKEYFEIEDYDRETRLYKVKERQKNAI